MPTYHLLIKGQVQGVFYRATSKKTADQLDISGWVKNTPDGNVEIIATGTEEKVQQFIAWCKQGPALAQVSAIIATRLEEVEFPDFLVKR